MKLSGKIMCAWLALVATVLATELKVDLNPPDNRKDLLTPRWANWAWHEGQSGAQTFGAVTVVFRAVPAGLLAPVLFKGSLDFGAIMAADGISLINSTNSGGMEMVIGGLTSGRHTIVTYHNEVRDLPAATFDVSVGSVWQIKKFTDRKSVV